MKLFNKKYQEDKESVETFLKILPFLSLLFQESSVGLRVESILLLWKANRKINRNLLLAIDPTMKTRIVRRMLAHFPG